MHESNRYLSLTRFCIFLLLLLLLRSFFFFFFFQDQETPLHIAAASNKIEAVAALISHGADVNARNKGGETPLMWASFKGHAKVVEALLDAGADKELKATSGSNWKGNTALDVARKYNKGDVVAILEGRR